MGSMRRLTKRRGLSQQIREGGLGKEEKKGGRGSMFEKERWGSELITLIESWSSFCPILCDSDEVCCDSLKLPQEETQDED